MQMYIKYFLSWPIRLKLLTTIVVGACFLIPLCIFTIMHDIMHDLLNAVWQSERPLPSIEGTYIAQYGHVYQRLQIKGNHSYSQEIIADGRIYTNVGHWKDTPALGDGTIELLDALDEQSVTTCGDTPPQVETGWDLGIGLERLDDGQVAIVLDSDCGLYMVRK